MDGLIVVSDDEPMLVRSLERQLRKHGIRVVADVVSKTVEVAKSCRPDLILLDICQPVDGLEILRQLKSDPETRSVSVLVISAVDSTRVRNRCLALGAEDFIVKPFDRTLVYRITELVGRKTGEFN